MREQVAHLSLCAVLFALCVPAQAQQPKTMPRVGWVWFGPATGGHLPALESAFIDGLRELNYVENRNFTFDHRFAAGHPERLPDLVKDLVRQNVDVIITLGGDLAADRKTNDQNDSDRFRCQRGSGALQPGR